MAHSKSTVARKPRRNFKARLAELEKDPLAQVLCGGGEVKWRARFVGRWHRSVRWITVRNLIAPDWREVRSGAAAGLMPNRTVRP